VCMCLISDADSQVCVHDKDLQAAVSIVELVSFATKIRLHPSPPKVVQMDWDAGLVGEARAGHTTQST
jgi:hypothetical protein